MTKVIIDLSVSLDEFVAGPDDNRADPLGAHGGMQLFDWYFSGDEEYRDPLFRPETGANRDEVERMFDESGAFIFGRRTYEIAHTWGGPPPSERGAGLRAHARSTRRLSAPALEPHVGHGRHRERRPPGARRGGRPEHQARRSVTGETSAGRRTLRRDPDPPRALCPRWRCAPLRRAAGRGPTREVFRSATVRSRPTCATG